MKAKREQEDHTDQESKKVRRDAPTDPSRALFIPNVGSTVTYYDLCKLANQYGAIDLVKINTNKKHAFVNFVEQSSAEKLYQAAQTDPPKLGGVPIKVGWARCEPLDQETLDAVTNGATRNLFVPSASGLAEDALAQTFSRFAEIENIVHIAQKNIAFVNLTSLKGAIAAQRAAAAETLECAGRKIRVNFAKEGVAARDPRLRAPIFPPAAPVPYPQSPIQGPPPAQAPQAVGASRSIFIGNLPEETSFGDLCKLGNRFGAVEQVTINHEKKNGFINFIDVAPSTALYTAAQSQPILIHNKPVRINWAKSNPLRGELLEQVRKGATRNLWVGGVPDSVTEDHLREVFAEFGDLDAIVIPKKAKNIAFVNFAGLRYAIAARTKFATTPLELHGVAVKVNFAKETIRGPAPVPQPPQPIIYDGPPQQPYSQPYAPQPPQPYAQPPQPWQPPAPQWGYPGY